MYRYTIIIEKAEEAKEIIKSVFGGWVFLLFLMSDDN